MTAGKNKPIMDYIRELVKIANTGRNCENELAFIAQKLVEERALLNEQFADEKAQYMTEADEKIAKLMKENKRMKVLLNATADFIGEHVEKPE